MFFKKCLGLLDRILSIHPPVLDSVGSFDQPVNIPQDIQEENEKGNKHRFLFDKIRFDNTFRISVSTIILLVCWLKGWGGDFYGVQPIITIYIVYSVILIGLFLNVKRFKNIRWLDYTLCTMDIVALSIGVYFTGGKESPLYFVYFIPLVIHSYHRDWYIILLYGFGGVSLYSLAVLLSIQEFTAPVILDFIAQVLIMLLTVSIATIAVNLLRKRDTEDQTRLSHMYLLAKISHTLNRVSNNNDLKTALTKVAAELNREFGANLASWVRILAVQENSRIMNSIMDPHNARFDIKQEVGTGQCPAFQKQRDFIVKDTRNEESCPVEQFQFRAHLCIPILGTDNESRGVLFIGSENPNPFSDDHRKVFNFIARSLGLTIERLRKSEESSKLIEMDSCATAAFVKSTRDVDSTYESILDGIMSILKVDQGSLLLWEKSIGYLVTRKVIGPCDSMEKDFKFTMGESIPGRVLEEGKPIWTNEIETDSKFKEKGLPFKSLLSIPLFSVQAEPVGVINVWSYEANRMFSPFEVDLASTFVTRAAVAIENAKLHKKSKNGHTVAPPTTEEETDQAAA